MKNCSCIKWIISSAVSLMALVLWLGTAMSSSAAIITWSNPAGGGWNIADNWTPNQVPGAADTAILALTATVTVEGSITVSNVTFSNGTLAGSGTLIVSGIMIW